MSLLVKWIWECNENILIQGLNIQLQLLKEQKDKKELMLTLIGASAKAWSQNKTTDQYRIFTDLLEVYRTNVAEFDRLPWFTEILEYSHTIDVPLVYSLAYIDYLQVALELVSRDDIKAYNLMSRLNKVLPDQPIDMYYQVYNYGLELQSHRYTESFEPLLRQQIIDRVEPIEKPSYVLDEFLPETEYEPELEGVVINPYLLSSASEILGLGMSREQAAEMVENYQNSNPLDTSLTKNISKIVSRYKLSSDEELFKRYGPVNTLVSDRLDMDHKCSDYGGCRMFLCTCMEGNKYLDYEDCDSDWFYHMCQWDMKFIPSRSWAWRIPLPIGGWRGCYCSEECARNAASTVVEPIMGVQHNNLTEEEVENIYASLTLVIHNGINAMARDLKRIGVYDRKEVLGKIDTVHRETVYHSGHDESGLSLPPDIENEYLWSQIYPGRTTLLSSSRDGEDVTERSSKLNDLHATDYLDVFL